MHNDIHSLLFYAQTHVRYLKKKRFGTNTKYIQQIAVPYFKKKILIKFLLKLSLKYKNCVIN